MKKYLVARLMEHSFLHNLLDPLLWFTFTTPYIYTEPVADSLLHYQLAKCKLREHLKLTHFPVKRGNSVKLVHMWITLKSPRVRESHSWFLREVEDDALFVDSKMEEKREKDENMGTFFNEMCINLQWGTRPEKNLDFKWSDVKTCTHTCCRKQAGIKVKRYMITNILTCDANKHFQ